MTLTIRTVSPFLVVLTSVAIAQTTVTTSGGPTGSIPVFAGVSDIEQSVITAAGISVNIDGFLTAATANGGNMIVAHQVGAGYGDPGAMFSAQTDNPVGSSNYFFQGLANGVLNFSVRADGNAYFGNSMSIINPSLSENPNQNASIGSTLVLAGSATTRTVGQGPSLTFAFPANTDGSNQWEQARILAAPDDASTQSANGRLYLQVRNFYASPGSGTAWNWRTGLMIQANGNTGIGTDTPGATLEVNGNVKLTSGSGASVTYADGTVQSTAWNGVLTGGDYAESVDVSGDRTHYEPGDVLVIDRNAAGHFLKAATPYSTSVTGIYSTKPGLVGRRQLTDKSNIKDEVPMAMTGIVPTKVTAENGPIEPGDLLVTSSRIGYAMKGTDRGQMLGAVIGKALGQLDSGTGVIEVVVTLQ
jgi:hypothetical protein